MSQIPDIAIFVDPKREATAISECKKLGITIISIIDTDCDPTMIDIPIPANDDGVKSVQFILDSFKKVLINTAEEEPKKEGESSNE